MVILNEFFFQMKILVKDENHGQFVQQDLIKQQYELQKQSEIEVRVSSKIKS